MCIRDRVGPVGLGCTRKGLRLQPALDRDDFLRCVQRLGQRCNKEPKVIKRPKSGPQKPLKR
eukprot:6354557-Amphidinium_carterae.1